MSYSVPSSVNAHPFNVRHGLRLLRQIWFDRAQVEEQITPLLDDATLARGLAMQITLAGLLVMIGLFAVPVGLSWLVNRVVPLDDLALSIAAVYVVVIGGIALIQATMSPKRAVFVNAGIVVVPLSFCLTQITGLLLLLIVPVPPLRGAFRFSVAGGSYMASVLGINMFEPKHRESDRFELYTGPWIMIISGIVWAGLEILKGFAMFYGSPDMDPAFNTVWNSLWMQLLGFVAIPCAVLFFINVANRDQF